MVICEWFALVRDIKAKYGILDEDTYKLRRDWVYDGHHLRMYGGHYLGRP